MNGADMASLEYERLVREMLAVEPGDFDEVKDAMRQITASAPDTADLAFLLSRAFAQAADQALQSEATVLPSRNQEALGRAGTFPQ
jgi:thioredoxin-like negative regulator of GroEL